MSNLDSRFNRHLAWLVLGSLLVFVTVTVFRFGVNALPYDSIDAAGHRAGFNDPLYPAHYWMMVQRCHLADFFQRGYTYEWLLLGAHLVGLGLLLAGGKVPSRLTRWFFALQALVFPWGFSLLPVLLGCLVYPGVGHFGIGREFWNESPAILILSAPAWVWAALAIAWGMRGEELGIKRACGKFFVRRGTLTAKKNPPGQMPPESLRALRAGV